jgi:hypothetical protein
MARKPTQAQLLDELLTHYDRRVADAFHAAVDDLKSRADLGQVVDALSRRDLTGAIEALHLDPAAYAELLDAIRAAYSAGGQVGADALPQRTPDGAALVIRFNARNARAEAWLQAYSSDLVTRVLDDQRAAIRQRLVAGMEAGEAPRTTALSIVGRVSRATGKREGGVIGLTAAQEGYVRRAREELTSGDPVRLKAYLNRARRSKTFDRSVAKAIREGAPVPADTVRKALNAYERRLLQLRGEMIGRTEALRSLNAGAYEALRQAVDTGKITAAQVRRTWRSAGDLRVRHTHAALNGDTVGLDESFKSPSGARLMYPGDPSAPAAETINCRCIVQPRIDFLANIR